MINLKFLQKLFFLLMMGFSFNIICACDDDEESAPFEYSEAIIPISEAVDLGLSVKWAIRNVGADTPEEYGDYYAWGETEEKDDYSWETYKWCNGSGNSMTKYCTNRYYGTVDNKVVLDPKDDVARVKWGGSWRMPTWSEFEELLEKCTLKLASQKGRKGIVVIGPNGNTIFLPLAGSRSGTTFYSYEARYWSATLHESYSNCAYALHTDDKYYYDDYWYYGRYFGFPVRPVTK